jgi:oligopeptidase A
MNPLLHIDADTDLGAVTATHVREAIPQLLESLAAARAALAACALPTWADVAALDLADARLSSAHAVVSNLRMTTHAPELESAWDAVFADVQAGYTRMWADADLLAALRRVEPSTLDPAQRRYLEVATDQLARNGADLDDEDRERLVTLDGAIARLTLAYGRAVVEDAAAWSLDVTDASTLVGLADDLLTTARERAAAAGVQGWRFSLDPPTYRGVLRSGEDAKLRETFWRAWTRRGHDSNPDRIERILLLRRERASLLGFGGFTDLVTADRMAANAETVGGFLASLADHARPVMERERSELEGFCGYSTQPWDLSFESERLLKARHDVDAAALKPWFPLPRVLDGSFELIHRLFGVRVVSEPGGGWADGVRSYRLEEEDGSRIGRFHLDLHPRSGKRSGAWMSGVSSGAVGAPLGIVCGNMVAGAGGEPALLTHREVVTVLHELGHLMHHLLSESSSYLLWGTAVPRDFVELPSQLLEEWAWTRDGLDRISEHVEQGGPLPDDRFAALTAARGFRTGSASMRQVGLATLDLALHEDWEPDESAVEFAYRVSAEFSPRPAPEGYSMVCSFGHLFSSPVGYAGGYYVYKWAEALSVDAFGAFTDAGVLDAATGRRFRSEVLARGNTVDVMDQFVAFRGREPSLEPLLARVS